MVIVAVRRWECRVFAPSTHESSGGGGSQMHDCVRRRVERVHVGGQRLRQCVVCHAIVLPHWCVYWACALGCVIGPSAAGSCLAGRAAGPLGCVRWLLRPALSHTTRRTLRAARSHSRTHGLRATQALAVCSVWSQPQRSVRSGWWRAAKSALPPQNQPRWFSRRQQWRCHSHCSTLSSRQTTHSCTLCHTLPTCAAGAVVVAPCVRARGGAESQGARRRPWKLVRWSCWCGRS